MRQKALEVRVSRVINAEKWRIIRLITHIDQFPRFMPNVKEAVVLKKVKNKLKTKWRIQMDEVPISWIEEDTLDFSTPGITFKAIEGDLPELSGRWSFLNHPDGTLVKVYVKLVVGIPAIQEFADTYIRKMIESNFESMLESLENRLISVRYKAFRKGNKNKIAGFGVIGHLYNFNHLAKCMKMLNPKFKMPSREFIGKLFAMSPSFKLYDFKNIKSKTGQTTHGCFIVTTFIPDMVSMDVKMVFNKVVRACKLAEKYGVGVVTLGGFSSIVGERYGKYITKEVDVPLTTGNTYTAVLAIDGINKAVKSLGTDLKNAKMTIIGGTGDIGSACARAFAGKVRHLVITGRTKSNLRKMWFQLKFRYGARHVDATSDNKKAIKDADIVIACASVSASILKIEDFKPGAIICDLAYPKNVSYTPTDRKDILIFSGGLAKMHGPIHLPVDIGLPSLDTVYGCFSEAILLSFEKRYENYSRGRGNITLDRIDEMRAMGQKHGLKVAPFYWGNKLIDDKEINTIKRNIMTKKAPKHAAA